MNKAVGVAIHSVAAILLAVVTLTPAIGARDSAVVPREHLTGDRSPSAPIVVAQGRCFNGRCF